MLALALYGSWGLAHAAGSALHNDLDGDGRSDLIWRNAATGSVVYWSGANAAHATPVRISRNYNVPGFDLARASIEFSCGSYGSPRRDLIIRNDDSRYVQLTFNYDLGWGYVAFDPQLTFDSPDWKLVGAGDFNQYGDDHFFYRNQRTGSNMVSYWSWDGPLFLALPAVTNLDWSIVSVSDFDGDGVADLLWRNAVTGSNNIWKSADPRTQQPVVRVSDLAWRIVAVADFNGDGKSDIFWRNTSTGANVIWNSGNHATPRAVPYVTNQSWQVTAIGDFDGDGRFDLFWRNSSTGGNVIWKSANRNTQLAVGGVSNQAWSTVM
ncbi:MAG: FG-GAP repeat domain-containing protein [Luteimonas sp.]